MFTSFSGNVSAAVRGASLALGLLASSIAVISTTAGPASAAPAWCGSWLENPSVASNVAAVSGTWTGWNMAGVSTEMQINKGKHDGVWYTWAKMYRGINTTARVAEIWTYASNNGTYQCGYRNNSYATPGKWSSPCSPSTGHCFYTSGVDKAHTYKVQVKGTFSNEHQSYDSYGDAVVF